LQQLRRDAGGAPARQPLLSNAVLLCAVGFAFSPVIVDLARHLVADPWSRYSAIFLPLLVVTAAREETTPPPHRAGYAWLVLGLAIALIAVAGGEPRFGRVGLPLGIIGLCRARGFGSWRTLPLAFWIVPIPNALNSLGSPEIETLYLRLAAAVTGVFGSTIAIEQATASAGGAVLELSGADAGLSLVALLSGLGWYASLRARSDLLACLARALGWGLLGHDFVDSRCPRAGEIRPRACTLGGDGRAWARARDPARRRWSTRGAVEPRSQADNHRTRSASVPH